MPDDYDPLADKPVTAMDYALLAAQADALQPGSVASALGMNREDRRALQRQLAVAAGGRSTVQSAKKMQRRVRNRGGRG